MGFKWSSKRVREAKKETGLSGDEIRQIAQDLGIKNFNSRSERNRVIDQARQNQVTSAYQDVLNRAPDQGGLQHYIQQMDDGRSIAEIRSEMQGSDEYKSTFGSGDTRATVQAVSDATSKADDFEGKYNELRGSYDSQISGYQSTIRGLEDSISGIKSEYEGQLERFKKEMDEGIAKYRGMYDSEVKGREEERTRMQTAFDEKYAAQEKDFLDQLNAQARAEAAQQLAGLRAGSTASATARPTGAISLASGQTTASRREKGPVMDVRPEVNATDSVLDRSGPVVQLINNLRTRRPSGGGGGGGRSPMAGGGASNYYASRFG